MGGGNEDPRAGTGGATAGAGVQHRYCSVTLIGDRLDQEGEEAEQLCDTMQSEEHQATLLHRRLT